MFRTLNERAKLLFLLLLMVIVGSWTLVQPAHGEEKFVINSHGFSEKDVQRVRKELNVGLNILGAYGVSILTHKFPVVVNLWAGGGVSISYHGRGPIELYFVKEVRSPIIHELTHVLAGYNYLTGHWTQEGFASYMQDVYGQDRSFPTYKRSHALAKVIIKQKNMLPMLEVMKDRRRRKYFGIGTKWERWLAYVQSTSFCRYLIEKYGMDKFLKIYNLAFETMDFPEIYGKNSLELVSEWEAYISQLDVNTSKARRKFMYFKRRFK